jgi:hypothetical protein
VENTEFDHALIHIDNWIDCNDFYVRVLGAEIVANPEGKRTRSGRGSIASAVSRSTLTDHGPNAQRRVARLRSTRLVERTSRFV